MKNLIHILIGVLFYIIFLDTPKGVKEIKEPFIDMYIIKNKRVSLTKYINIPYI